MATLPLGAWGQTKTWDFRSWSPTTIANLEAVATTTTPSSASDAYRNSAVWNKKEGSGDNEGSYYYDYYEIYQNGGSAQSAQVLKAGENVIDETSDLTFYIPNNAKSRLRIDNRTNSKALFLSSSSEKINIPGLEYGKKVTITCKGNTSGINSKMVSENANAVAYKQTEASTAERTDVFVINFKVTSPTTMAFKIDNGSMNIYTISIEDATEDEIKYADLKTLFGSDEVITATSLWTFNQYKAGDAISDGSYSGIYLKGHDTGTNKSVAGNFDTTSTFGDYTISTSKYLDVKGGYKDITYSTIQTRLASSTIQDCVSLNIGVAGKLYITASLGEASRSIKVFKGNTGDITELSTILIENHSVSAANTPETFNVEITQAGTYWITGANGGNGSGYRIYAMMFVPSTDKDIAMTKTVNITSAGYATFSATQNYDLPDGLEAYIVSGVNGTTATMTKVTEIPACTGVILKGAEGPYTLTSKETTSVDVSSNMLKANIADYILPVNDGNGNYNYTLAAGPTFKHVNDSGTDAQRTLAAGKAFLRTTVNASEAHGLDFVFENETTGIKTIDNSHLKVDNYFNLSGQRVAQPTRGLYIVNGKKVVIK